MKDSAIKFLPFTSCIANVMREEAQEESYEGSVREEESANGAQVEGRSDARSR